MQATREVGSAIEGIQSGTTQNIAQVNDTVNTIEHTTELAGTSGAALSEIVVLVDQAADQAHSIATAAEEQSSTSDEINKAVEQINTISAETSSAMALASLVFALLWRRLGGFREARGDWPGLLFMFPCIGGIGQ